MYKSPIEIMQTKMRVQMENGIVKAVQDVGINVDKVELLKALAYDREQYQKGYADGREAGHEWISVSESPKENGIYCVMVENHKSRKVKKRTYARYRNGRWLDLYDNWENRCWHVTHWMPLPESPEEDEHGT